ncbi:hypothetical protein HQ529_05175 [Candidatus Woesearchaeota archaeon]|nr:hypothetical protein [Candidatus Woesearchaeota archaeon]
MGDLSDLIITKMNNLGDYNKYPHDFLVGWSVALELYLNKRGIEVPTPPEILLDKFNEICEKDPLGYGNTLLYMKDVLEKDL